MRQMRTRVVQFPAESLGELLDERFREWPKIAEAQGEVTILGRPKLVLRLIDLPDRQRTFLTSIPTDLLYGICFTSAPNCEAAVPYLLASHCIRMIDLSGSGIGDDVFLRLIKSLPYLRTIYFGGTRISEFAFRDMPRLLSVRVLRSFGRSAAIGDRGAVSAGLKMPRLLTLDFSNADITDEGVRGISHLPLRTFNISGNRITDAGLASLVGMCSLRKLALSYTKISDAALYFLQFLPRLTLLMLDGTVVTDEGLPYLQKLSSLRVLYLSGTQITDKAVRWLVQMRSLRVLSLGQQLSLDGAESIRKALPNCKISAI
jgi:Leucine-rich repeat (LRR) protein